MTGKSDIRLFLIPIGVGILIQLLKLVIDVINEKRISFSYFWRAGGFPSVHSALVSSVTTLMFLLHGPNSEFAAMSLVFSILFWYDAMNVRYQAGIHAQVINRLRTEISHNKNMKKDFAGKNVLDIPSDSPLNITPEAEETLAQQITLKERLGHTLYEVIGGIVFGVLLTWIAYRILNLA